MISSQSTSEDITWKRTNDVFEVDVPFVRVNQTTLFPWRFLAFRLFSLTLGRHPLVARYLKSLLVSILVTRKKKDVAKLKRSVVFKKDAVLIEDSICMGSNKCIPGDLYWSPKFSTIHMGSSRYFQADDLNLPSTKKMTSLCRKYRWNVAPGITNSKQRCGNQSHLLLTLNLNKPLYSAILLEHDDSGCSCWMCLEA